MRPTSGSAGAVSDPVFVDRSGRRGRLVKRAGVLVSLLGLAYGVALVSLALVGVHISAPGLPLLESSVGTVNGNRPADPHRAAPRPATVTNRPKSTPTTRSATNTIRMTGAGAAASPADGDTTSTRAARVSKPDPQSTTQGSGDQRPGGGCRPRCGGIAGRIIGGTIGRIIGGIVGRSVDGTIDCRCIADGNVTDGRITDCAVPGDHEQGQERRGPRSGPAHHPCQPRQEQRGSCGI